MSSTEITIGVTAAVLLFWTVGAHNRLVNLRNAIVRSFVTVDEQFRLRHALLLQQLDALALRVGGSSPTLEALRAAVAQASAACAHASARPGAAGAVTSLRLAETILTETRARVPARTTAAAGLAEIDAQLAASDNALAFARGRFNKAVAEYNSAVGQFPTWLIAALFSFRPAGTL